MKLNQGVTLLILAVMVCRSTSRFIPQPCPGRNLLSTIANLVALAEDCGCPAKKPCGCGCKDISTSCGCGPQFVDVILPPLAAELPCGLGYLPAAAPLVAAAYGCADPRDACVPVTSPYSCTALATPQCAELRAFAKPIIL